MIEAALARRLKDKAEAAYARGDLFVKRRKLMEDWSAYLTGTAAGAVVPLTRRTAGPAASAAPIGDKAVEIRPGRTKKRRG